MEAINNWQLTVDNGQLTIIGVILKGTRPEILLGTLNDKTVKNNKIKGGLS